MFPLRDDNPTRHVPVVTWLLIAANAASWFFVQGIGAEAALAKSVFEFGLIPGELLGGIAPGTQIPVSPKLVYITEASANWSSIFTHMFMHGGWLHLIGNLWFLGVFGNNVEDAMGPFRFTAFYLLCGLCAALAQVITAPASAMPMVGASGAIGGVMGAYAILYPMARVHLLVFLGFFVTTVAVPAFLMLFYWFLLQLSAGLVGGIQGVAVWAHVGGFAAGIIFMHPFCRQSRLRAIRRRRRR